MAEALSVRASALPLAFRCPASIRRGDLVINESHDAANDGTAAHHLYRTLPTTGKIDWDDVPDTATRLGANPDEVRMLTALGAKLWNQVSESFLGAMTEVELSCEIAPGVFLTGHADLLAVSQTSMRVGDWKTGRKDTDHSHQFRAYASLALLSSESIETATGTGLWVRDQEIENYTLSRADAQTWLRSVVSEIVDWDGVYRTGHHCLHCPRAHECPAANAQIRQYVAAIADKGLVARAEADLATMPAEEIVAVLHKADMVEKYAKRVRDAIRTHVMKNGDIVAGGVRLTVNEESRRELDPLKAWPLLEDAGFDDEDLARVVKLRLSEIQDVVRGRAPRGEKKAAAERLVAQFEAHGAIKTHTIKKLQEKRA